MYIGKMLLKIVVSTTLLSILVAVCIGQAPAMATPQPPQALVVLVDASYSSQPNQIASRSAIARILAQSPDGTPFALISFNRSAKLLFAGHINTSDAVSALESLDKVRTGGPTDLGVALEFAAAQPLAAHGYDAVVVSDFSLDPPPASPWAHRSLNDVLNAAHGKGMRRVLLVAVGGSFGNDTIPPYASTGKALMQSPAPWLAQLLPPPAAAPVPAPKPETLWHRKPFFGAVLLTALLIATALRPLSRYAKSVQEARLLKKLTATPEAEEALPCLPTEEQAKESAKPVKKRIFMAVILQDGRQMRIPIGAGDFKVGEDFLADLFVDGARTTFTLAGVAEATVDTLMIRNSGEQPAHIGRQKVMPGQSARLPWGETADCVLAPNITLRLMGTTAKEEQDGIL